METKEVLLEIGKAFWPLLVVLCTGFFLLLITKERKNKNKSKK